MKYSLSYLIRQIQSLRYAFNNSSPGGTGTLQEVLDEGSTLDTGNTVEIGENFLKFKSTTGVYITEVTIEEGSVDIEVTDVATNSYSEVVVGDTIKVYKDDAAGNSKQLEIEPDAVTIDTNFSGKKPIATGTGLETLKVSLTAAQIKTGNSLPIEILPALTGGKIYGDFQGYARYNEGAEPFDAATSLAIIQTSNIGNFPIENLLLFDGMDVDGISIGLPSIQNPAGYKLLENDSISALIDADSTTGDGTIDIYLSYRIITL